MTPVSIIFEYEFPSSFSRRSACALVGNCNAGPDHPQFTEMTPEQKVVRLFGGVAIFGNSMPLRAVLIAK